jgi:hypothetical protein
MGTNNKYSREERGIAREIWKIKERKKTIRGRWMVWDMRQGILEKRLEAMMSGRKNKKAAAKGGV